MKKLQVGRTNGALANVHKRFSDPFGALRQLTPPKMQTRGLLVLEDASNVRRGYTGSRERKVQGSHAVVVHRLLIAMIFRMNFYLPAPTTSDRDAGRSATVQHDLRRKSTD